MNQATLRSVKYAVLRQVRAEPRKALVLAAVGTTVIVMWTRLALFGVAAPGAASGATPQSAGTELPVAAAAAPPADTPALRALLDWTQGPIAPTSRNVFALKLEYFPTDGSKPPPTPENPEETFWAHLAKSMANRADQEKARRILVENLQTQAAKLELQSTVMNNGDPKALINGSLLGEGDQVLGFKILKIEPKRVIVEREGVKLEVGFGF